MPERWRPAKAWSDAGEAAAIALVAELTCEVILDDLQARRLASRQGVRCVGLLGVLLRAKFSCVPPLVAEALRLAEE